MVMSLVWLGVTAFSSTSFSLLWSNASTSFLRASGAGLDESPMAMAKVLGTS